MHISLGKKIMPLTEGVKAFEPGISILEARDAPAEVDVEVNSVLQESGDITAAGMRGANNTGRFIRTIFGEDGTALTPHYIRLQSRLAQQTNQGVASAVRIFCDTVIGGGVSYRGGGKREEKAWNHLFREFNMDTVISEMAESLVVTGDVYTEVMLDEDTEKACAFKVIQRPEDIFKSFDKNNHIEYYILKVRLPHGMAEKDFHRMGHWPIHGQWQGTIAQYGVKFPSDSILNDKIGGCVYNMYGEGYYAAAADDYSLCREITRGIAVRSRYMGLPRNIFTIKPVDLGNGMTLPVTQDVVDKFTDMIESLPDNQQIFTNKEISATGLYTDEVDYQKMIYALDWHSMRMVTGIIPAYLLHGFEYRSSSAKEQRSAFFNRINYMRNVLRGHVIRLLKRISDAYGLSVSEEATLEFTELSVRTPHENSEDTRNDWDRGGVTLNEYREAVGRELITRLPVMPPGFLLPPGVTSMGELFKFELGGVSEYRMTKDTSSESEGDGRKTKSGVENANEDKFASDSNQ